MPAISLVWQEIIRTANSRNALEALAVVFFSDSKRGLHLAYAKHVAAVDLRLLLMPDNMPMQALHAKETQGLQFNA